MTRHTFDRATKTFAQAALLVAGLSLAGCATEDAPERERGPHISLNAGDLRNATALGTTTTVQVELSNPVIPLSALLGNAYATSDLSTFVLLNAESERGADLAYDASAESVTLSGALSTVWDRLSFQVCTQADPSDCTERTAHVILLDEINACAPEAVGESFSTNALRNEWFLGPTAALTAGMTGGDPADEGWLRLSNLTNYSYSDALLNESFPSVNGVSISFESAQWGSRSNTLPGDGLTFFLVDGDKISVKNPNAPTTNLPPVNAWLPEWLWQYNPAIDLDDSNQMFRSGAAGGSLGYAQRKTSNGFMPGLKHGVIGIGFDASGYFATNTEGKVGGIDSRTHVNSITLRGNDATNWAFIESTDTIADLQLGCSQRNNGIAACNTARPPVLGDGRYKSIVNIIALSTNAAGEVDRYRVTVYTQSDETAGYIKRIDSEINQILPKNLKLGFTGSSGGSAVSFNEIRDVAVEVLADLSVDLAIDRLTPSNRLPVGEEITLTYTVTNKLPSTVCAASVDLRIPAGFVVSSQTCDASAGGENATCGELGTLGVTEDFISLGGLGEAVITIKGHVSYVNEDELTLSGRVTPSAGQGDLDPLDNFVSVTAKISQAPTLQDQTLYVIPGQPRAIDIIDGATPGSTPIDPSTATVVTAPADVTTVIVDGQLTVTLPSNATETDIALITVQVKDEDGVSSAPATITVIPNPIPVITSTEVWVPVGQASADVVFESSDVPFTTSIKTQPTGAQATVSGDTVTVQPTNVGEALVYDVGLEVCDTGPGIIACADATVRVVYNDPPNITGGSAFVPQGGSAALDPKVNPGVLGTIKDVALVGSVSSPNGVCAIRNGKVTFKANATAALGPAVCTLRVCEEQPTGLCSDAEFTFNVVAAFTPTDDTIAGAQGETSTVTHDSLLANDGNVTKSTFRLIVGTAFGGTATNTNGNIVFVTSESATAGSFQYAVCSGWDTSFCRTVNVSVDIAVKPTATLIDVWTLVDVPVSVESPFDSGTVVTVDTSFAGGTAAVQQGEIIVTPATGHIGELTVPVKGCTPTTPAACTTTTVTVTVNDKPTLGDEVLLVAPGQPAVVTPDASPGQIGVIDASSLTITQESTPNGACALEDGNVKYVANTDAIVGQTDSCVVEICEEQPAGACDTATFSFEITASFDPTDDTFETVEEVSIDIKTQDLLINDGGVHEGSFALVGAPDAEGVITTTNGSLVANNDGDGYIYTPAAGFFGDDSFLYEVCSAVDPSECKDVTVTIIVSEAPPTSDTTVWVVTGTPDVEVDMEDSYVGDEAIQDVEEVSVGPEDDNGDAPGAVTIVGGVVTFVPTDLDAAAVYEVVVSICDVNVLCEEATITIVYNDPPTPGAPIVKVAEDKPGDSYTLPYNVLIDGTTPGDVDGGWDETSLAVSNDPEGTFDETAQLDGASCAIVEDELVYTVTDQMLPKCYVQFCELNPGPAGVDTTNRACTVIEVTPEIGAVDAEDADVVITSPADNSQTNDATPTVTGKGEPGQDVIITVDGERVGTVTVDDQGNWSWTPNEDLADGVHTIVAEGENGSKDQLTLTIGQAVGPNSDLAISGGRLFGCASTGGNAPAPLMVAAFVGLGLVLRRRANGRS